MNSKEILKAKKNTVAIQEATIQNEPVHNVCGIEVFQNDLLHQHMKRNSKLWNDIENWD